MRVLKCITGVEIGGWWYNDWDVSSAWYHGKRCVY